MASSVATVADRAAPTLIMLHGLGLSGHTWEPWARALDSTYRVIRFNRPGSGLKVPDLTGHDAALRSR